jgi:hypothetical protein
MASAWKSCGTGVASVLWLVLSACTLGDGVASRGEVGTGSAIGRIAPGARVSTFALADGSLVWVLLGFGVVAVVALYLIYRSSPAKGVSS